MRERSTWRPVRGPFGNDWNWRNFQLVWWGWRWALCSRPFAFERCVVLAAVFRWSLFLGPLEIRRWAEDWRDQRRRLGLEG